MKRLLPLLTLFLATNWLSAQITLTDAGFPATGDTLKTATDLMPSGIEVTAPGGPFDWDYSGLNANTTSQTVFLDANQGSAAAEIPTATHVVIDDFTGTEGYYRVTTEKVEFVASVGADPVGFGVDAVFRFMPPVVQRRAPLIFPASNTSESNLAIAFAWSDLPAFLTDSLNLPFAPDSIRVRVTSTRNDFVDAFGTLTIPGGTYDVLREKRTEFRETSVEALLPFLGWQPVTDLLTAGFQGLGMDTLVSYEFYSNDAKEVITALNVDPTDETTVISVSFKDNGIVNANEEVVTEQPLVRTIPNPVKDQVRFELDRIPAGLYILNLTDMEGRTVVSRDLQIAGYQHEWFDLSALPGGIYFYYLLDERGQTLSNGKLVKH